MKPNTKGRKCDCTNIYCNCGFDDHIEQVLDKSHSTTTSTPIKSGSKGWEKRLQELMEGVSADWYDDLKQFIASEIALAREEGYKQGHEDGMITEKALEALDI